MGERAMSSVAPAQVFKKPGQAESLACVVIVQLLFALCAVVDPDLLEFSGTGLIAPACCVGTVVIFFWTYLQHVVIDGTFVQIRNSASFFQWRRFDVSEIASIHFHFQDSDAQFQRFTISLKPSTSRSWMQVRLKTDDPAGKHKGIDAPVMLAFMRAVTSIRPDIRIDNLPSEYRGALARPAPAIVQPSTPPGSGKTRKRKGANKKRRPKEKA